MPASRCSRRRSSPRSSPGRKRSSRPCCAPVPSAARSAANCSKATGRTRARWSGSPSSRRTWQGNMKNPDDISIYRKRREQLARAMQCGIAVVPTAPERVRNRDSHYPYRFDSHFYYLTGFTEPDAVLVMVAGKAPKSLLFCRNRDPEREVWDGFRYGPELARERFGFDEAQPVGELDPAMAKLLEDQPALYYPVGAEADWDARVMRWLNIVRGRSRAGVAAPERLQDVRSLLDEIRLVKDEHELATMRRAARIAAAA